MMVDFSQRFDGIINIITAMALIYYTFYMNVVEKNGGLRNRLLFLLSNLTLLCVARGVNYIFPLGEGVVRFIFVVSSIIPFALFLLVELLLRRHLPLVLKLLASSGSLVLVLSFLFWGVSKSLMMGLMMFYIFILLSMSLVIFFQDNLELEDSENSLIKICMVIMLLVVPLIVTDFKTLLGWNTPRLGAVGILFFLYALVKIWESIELKSALFRLFYLLILNLVSAKVISWVFNIEHFYFHVFIIFVMLRMCFDVFLYSKESYSKKAQETAFRIVDSFIAGDLKIKNIKKDMANDAFYLLSKEDLVHYRGEIIQNVFGVGGIHFKEEVLKRISGQDIREEMTHLYEDFDCNVCLFLKTYADNYFIILFKWPSIARKNKLSKEISLIQNIALKIKE